jgi:dTDP-4-dehydrorhamnose 3,5-epimerase
MAKLNVRRAKLDGVLIIEPPTIFEDFRGAWVELYNETMYREAGIEVTFVQDDISVSSKHVLRGIHGDAVTWKLLSCLHGKLYVVVVNCNTESTDFGRWESFCVSETNRLQILVPPNHGVAHLVMTDRAILHYKQSTYYNRAGQFTYAWDDPAFKIYWPVKDPILSKRDAGLE